jgi:hypothetical protein
MEAWTVSDLASRVRELLAGLVAEEDPQVGAFAPRADAPGLIDATSSGFAETVNRLVIMALDQFAREGQLLEVRVPWHAETFWFVPVECDAAALGHDGVGRGRVWTARELIALMALPDRTPATVRSLALAKREVDGDLVDVRPREPRGPSGPAGSGRRPGDARGG